MPTYEATRELLAPRADVWRFLSEPYNLADWWPGISGLQPDRRGLAPGARWQILGDNRPSLFRKPNMSGTLLVLAVAQYERLAFHLTGERLDVELTLAQPAVMGDLLKDKRIGVLYVGSTDSGVNQSIEQTLQDAGAAPPTRVVSLSVPVDAQNLDSVLFDKGAKFVKYVGDDKLENLGNALGTEFAAGGQTPLWKTLGRQLISERTGNARQPIDGVVVVRTAKPQQGDTMRFLRGVYSGLASAGVPAVGVENT